METTYTRIIEWTGDTFAIHDGKPSQRGFEATLADEFTPGIYICVVWQVYCQLTPEAVRQIVSTALRQ